MAEARAAQQAKPDLAALAALIRAGRLAEALASLERVLALEPHDLLALMAAGDCLCALGRPREAVPLYERALERNPRLREAHNNLGNAWQELGDRPRAVACYRQALALDSGDATAHANLGNALRQLGRLEEALASLERAVALDPSASVAHNNLGLALAACGRSEEAVASLRRAVELSPRFVQALHNLGNALCEAGDYRGALESYHRTIDLEPQHADTHCQLGRALHMLGRFDEAIVSYRRALSLQPAHPQAQLGLATSLRLEGRTEEAQALCRARLDADPADVGALSLLADLCADRGDFAEAEQLLQRALALEGSSAAVLCSIAALRRMTGADGSWRERAEQALAEPLPLAHQIGLRCALGKYYDDLGSYTQAFDQYRQANELSRLHGARYDPALLERQVDEAIRTFDRAFLGAPHPGASDTERPVFVVGMPRSGTSLTEQILASHPQAFGAGEVRYWERAAEVFAGAGPGSEARARLLSDLAREYLARIGASAGGARRVIDKMPGNFLHAGLIHAAFPRARIIHMRRHPLDTCLSLYFQNFGDLHPHAHDLENLKHYYLQYVRLTRHWRAVLPAATWLEVAYEELVVQQEAWTRRVLEFIGLPWEARCLDFHRTERVVITASRWQVRQKINSGSIGRWRNYAPYLEPLLPLLKLEGQDQPALP